MTFPFGSPFGDGVPFIGHTDPKTGEIRQFHSAEELAKFRAEQEAKNYGEWSAQKHNVERFLLTLEKDGLEALATILNLASDHEYSHSMCGRIEQLLSIKFNICAACGKNHDDELANLSKESTPEAAPETHDQLELPMGLELVAVFEPKTPQETTLEKMDRYNVKVNPARIAGDRDAPALVCKKCNMPYPTLEDRMLKDPEDCEGCRHQAQWG